MKKNNSGVNLIALKNYCQHFEFIQPSKIPPIKKLICNICKTLPPNTWICLSKGCGNVVCGRNRFRHMQQHNEESKFKHPIFLNSTTTEIRCVACNIQIYDFDQMSKEEYEDIKDKIDPIAVRRRFVKKESEGLLFKNGGNIENSEAHKKNSKGICTLLSKNGETAISSVIQFFSNIRFLKDVLKIIRVYPMDQNYKLLESLITILNKIWSGEVRIISINEFENIVVQCLASYKGYSRKNPLQLFTLLFNIIHDTVKFNYYLPEGGKEQQTVPDEWQIPKNQSYEYSIMKTNLCSNMTYKLKCNICKQNKQIQGQVYKLELQIPKTRKQSKVLEEEFERHKFESPIKNRRKSLVERFFKKQIAIPVSLPELIINYIKTKFPSSKQLKTCHKCKKQMTPIETKFSKLPNLLLIIIHSNQKDLTEIVERAKVEFSTQLLDMKGFVEQDYKGETQYEFQAAICEKDFQYVAVAKNKHIYQFMNDSVRLNVENLAPYVICYAIKNRHSNLYRNVKSNVKIQISPDYCLPNFWLEQLKHFQPYPLINPLICKHSKLKSNESKLAKYNYVPKQIYEALVDKFGGRMYENQKCHSCSSELHSLSLRRRKEKEYISKLDNYRCKIYYMVACEWLNKWTDYLYKRREDQYTTKGNPEPGPIDNAPIWDGAKFKQNLKKGEDFKLLNYYVWSFFKELYGGGPEIQYKTKAEDKMKIHQLCDAEVVKEIKEKVLELKQLMEEEYYLNQDWVESPIKKKDNKEESIKTFNSAIKE